MRASIPFALLALSACASSRVEVSSDPAGAEILSLQGEKLGITPALLSSDQLAKLGDDEGVIRFKLRAEGHAPRWIIADAAGTRGVSVSLPKNDADLFAGEILQDYQPELNQMLRRAFELQRLLAEKKIPQLESKLEKFRKDYPTLAFSHVLAGHLASLQGRKDEARKNLERARALDPRDSSLDGSLKLLPKTDAKIGTGP